MHNSIFFFFLPSLTFGTEHQRHKGTKAQTTQQLTYYGVFYFCNIIKMPQIEYSQWGK